MRSPDPLAESTLEMAHRLRSALSHWSGIAEELIALSGAQLNAVLPPYEGGDLAEILEAKELAYRAANEAAETVARLMHESPVQPDLDDAECQEETARIKEILRERLERLEELEDRSRDLVALRMTSIRTELERVHRSRANIHPYGAFRAPKPRFLDDRR